MTIPQIAPDTPGFIQVPAFIAMCGVGTNSFYQKRRANPHLPWPKVAAKASKKQFYAHRDIEAFLSGYCLREMRGVRQEVTQVKPDGGAFNNDLATAFVTGKLGGETRLEIRSRWKKLKAARTAAVPSTHRVRYAGDGGLG